VITVEAGGGRKTWLACQEEHQGLGVKDKVKASYIEKEIILAIHPSRVIMERINVKSWWWWIAPFHIYKVTEEIYFYNCPVSDGCA